MSHQVSEAAEHLLAFSVASAFAADIVLSSEFLHKRVRSFCRTSQFEPNSRNFKQEAYPTAQASRGCRSHCDRSIGRRL